MRTRACRVIPLRLVSFDFVGVLQVGEGVLYRLIPTRVKALGANSGANFGKPP
jgi:hypothetical protein